MVGEIEAAPQPCQGTGNVTAENSQTINSTSEHARSLRKQGIKDGITARDAPRAAVIELQTETDTPWLDEPAQALGGASAST